MPAAVTLVLSERLRKDLMRLLGAALNMDSGDSVADSLPADPWSNLEEFRDGIYNPLHGTPWPSAAECGRADLTLEPDDVRPIRDVLDGIAEAYSGGIPWVALDDRERDAATSLLSRLFTP